MEIITRSTNSYLATDLGFDRPFRPFGNIMTTPNTVLAAFGRAGAAVVAGTGGVRFSDNTLYAPHAMLTPASEVAGRSTVSVTNASFSAGVVFTGDTIAIPGVIGSGFTLPGYGYATKESSTDIDVRNGFNGDLLHYNRGGSIQFTINDVDLAFIYESWGDIVSEIATHPFVLILDRNPLRMAYVWCNTVPRPLQNKPNHFQITWDLTSYVPTA